jgi:type I restriction enzyme S subunit
VIDVENNELAEGWESAPLADLIAFAIGGDWGLPPEQANGTTLIACRVIRGTEFRNWDVEKGASAAIRAVSERKLESRRLEVGDLVLEVSGGGPHQPVGRTILVDAATSSSSTLPIICSNFCRRLRLKEELLPEFVWWVLRWQHFSGVFDRFQTQTTNLRNLNVTDFLGGIQIPLPPLAEQRRIVEKVEALLARVQATRERLARVPLILKRFRQAILAAACNGQLSADWRDEYPHTEPACELIARRQAAREASREATAKPKTCKPAICPRLDQIDSPFELPTTWAWASPDQLCDAIVDCPHSTPKWTGEGEICLRTTNFRPGLLELTEVRYVSSSTYAERIARLEPQPGDVVYSREGGILGIACVIPAKVRACLGQRMMLLRSDCNACLPPYLMHVLNSPPILAIVRDMTGGTASPHLNVGDIKAFPVPVPPLDEQHEIIRRLDALLKLADTIERRVAAATARADKLAQAILAKAFRGELVPTEAELARAEGRDYETAEQLLERIRLSHAAAAPESNGRPKAARRPRKKARRA